MKNIILLLLSSMLFSFEKHTHYIIPATSQQKDSTWIDGFREFRDAVYHNDRAKVKTFFNFPVATDNNYIWYLAYGGDINKMGKLTGKPNPFTEKDFDRYFENIFSKHFIDEILKIESDILYKKGRSITVSMQESDKATYNMFVTFDKESHELRIDLLTESAAKHGEDSYEHSDMYIFSVINNRQLRFKKIVGTD